MKSFKTWTDFLNYEGTRESRLLILKSSQLSFINPEQKRPLVWVGLINPSSSHKILDFYKSHCKVQSIPQELLNKIKQDASKITQSLYETSEKSSKIIQILSVFFERFPNFIYSVNLIHISIKLLAVYSLESDVFVILVHLYEEIYPKNFFSFDDNFSSRNEEGQVFLDCARKLRHKVLEDFTVKVKENGTILVNDSVFNCVIRGLADSWFSSIFTSNLLTGDFLRVFDCVLIHGFEFIQLFALSLFSHYERFFRNCLKNEVKSVKVLKSLDLLKVSGNVAKNKLIKKLEKVPVEKLIKKCLSKDSYAGLMKTKIKPVINENGEVEKRIEMIKEFKGKIGGISRDTALLILNSLEIYENISFVSRSAFSNFFTNNFNWTIDQILGFFSIFDQNGNDSMEVFYIKISLVLLVPQLDEQIDLFFSCADQDDLGYINRLDLIKLIKTIEESIYYRSCFYAKNCESNVKVFEKMTLNGFKEMVQEDVFFEALFKLVAKLNNCEFRVNPANPSKIVESFIEFSLSSPEKSPILHGSKNDVDIDEIPMIELDSYIEIIGDKGVNISIVKDSPEKIIKPAFIHINHDFESIEVVKDPNFIESFEKHDEEKDDDNRLFIASQKNLEIITPKIIEKDRNGCSRLCGVQNCSLF